MARLMAEHRLEGVIHFAAHKAVGESVEHPLKYYHNNVIGMVSLLEVLEQSGVPNLVFSSSCTVYGEPDTLPITEDSAVKPANSPYGATKQMCETIIRDTVTVSDNLRAVSLRYFNRIGAHPSALIGELPKGKPSNLVPFITQTVAGLLDKLIVFGDDYPTPDGTCIRDYIHVVDLAKAHVKALERLAASQAQYYDVYNVGTGKGSSVLEVINSFEEATGQKVNYEVGPRRVGDVTAVYAGVDKIQDELGWRAEKTMKEALVDAWRWQQKLKEEQ
jgi:UDP-glucose 4-epimerase